MGHRFQLFLNYTYNFPELKPLCDGEIWRGQECQGNERTLLLRLDVFHLNGAVNVFLRMSVRQRNLITLNMSSYCFMLTYFNNHLIATRERMFFIFSYI